MLGLGWCPLLPVPDRPFWGGQGTAISNKKIVEVSASTLALVARNSSASSGFNASSSVAKSASRPRKLDDA